MSQTQAIKERASTRPVLAVLVGNPNVGKSTIFNRLTGVHQRVGNYPGVTVERKSGILALGDRTITLVDLPGAYGLAAASPDERVVVDALAGNFGDMETPDLAICVVDATNLERNLFLVTQVADLGIPMVIALNLSDAARSQQFRIDHELLAQRLGVPVVPTVGTTGEGIPALRDAIASALETRPRVPEVEWPDPVRQACSRLDEAIRAGVGARLTMAELRRILFDLNSAIPGRIGWDDGRAVLSVQQVREELRKSGVHPFAIETMHRYDHLGRVLRDIVTEPAERVPTATEKIDRVLTHRIWGLVIFAGLMYIVFQSVYSWAGPAMDLIEAGKNALQDAIAGWPAGMPVVHSLISEGVIEGVGSVLVFLPQILVLFLFISLLEDTGYMARAAFLMDKLLSWCGLNGKSFVPLLSSYACAVPGILSTRTIEDPRTRLTTILISPLMSCSARLPVYVLLIGAFVEPAYGPWIAGSVLFAMHFVGLAIAIPIAFVLNKFVLRTRPQPFLLEMPPYRTPRPFDVIWRMLGRGRDFVVRAGGIIFAVTILVWALLYFPRPDGFAEAERARFAAAQAARLHTTPDSVIALMEAGDAQLSASFENRLQAAYVGQSYMGRFGKAVQPVFAPAGFDWKITVGVLSSFPAREVIIATLGVIYDLGGDIDETSGDLRSTLAAAKWDSGARAGQPVFTLPVVLAIMVFFALCMQCGATLAVIARESHWKWAIFAFCYMTALAWIGAVVAYQGASLIF